ncbi:MAG: NADH-ubiquinone oxidoreductase-F iron-sulfur binding region domain-containing protein [Oscillospiraceae bacterium]
MKTVRFISRNIGQYDPNSLADYEKIGGFRALKKALTMDGYTIAQVLADNGVQGRGGAAYDMGRKWSQARDVVAPKKCVVCNGDEGEPGTFKDRALLSGDPFQVLEGMAIAGFAVNAQDGYLYLREEYAHLRPLLLSAIAQCEAEHYLGEHICGTEFSYRIHLATGAGAYVCGEGSALTESLEGLAGRPRMKPPFMKQSGAFHLPTCVNNVESLSLVVPLLLDDEGFYKKQGTPQCPGTKMISVCGNVSRPGWFEVPYGITIREIIEDLAGGIPGGRALRLVQLGGASGKLATEKELDTPYTYDDLKKANLTPIGSGAVLVADDRTDVLDFLQNIQAFFTHECCGQCTPCREGNRHIALLLEKVAAGEHTAADVAQLRHLAELMCNTSFCGLGETAQSALLTALDRFPGAFETKEEVQCHG